VPLDVARGAEAVHLRLEHSISVVEWLRDAEQAHGISQLHVFARRIGDALDRRGQLVAGTRRLFGATRFTKDFCPAMEPASS
jgi:hypothetical protein